MKVFVYFNLHRYLWSIKALEGPRKGRVIGHARTVDLANVTFKVSEAGRQRVIRERKKNVHAGVVGDLELWVNKHGEKQIDVGLFDTAYGRKLDGVQWKGFMSVTYNPFKGPTFVRRSTGEAVHKAASAHLDDDRNVYAWED